MSKDAAVTAHTPITWKVRVLLLLFGTGVAVIISVIALQALSFSPKGTEFNSIADVRAAMESDAPLPAPDAGRSGQPVSLRALVRAHPDDSIIYTLRPHLDLTFMRAHVQTNSCGMRSPERPLVKPPGVYRIALLGDSFAFGWGVEQHEAFAQILENALNRDSKGGTRFEVLNFGVPGYSTFQEVALFEDLGIDFNPDAVLVYFVQNDFGMPFFIRDISGKGDILSSLKFVQLGKDLLAPGEMNRRIQELGLDPNSALKRLSRTLEERGIKGYLTINPRKSWRGDLGRLPAMKNTPSLSFIPLRDNLLEHMERAHIKAEELTLSFDPHPSPLRHRILGELLAAHLLSGVANKEP